MLKVKGRGKLRFLGNTRNPEEDLMTCGSKVRLLLRNAIAATLAAPLASWSL